MLDVKHCHVGKHAVGVASFASLSLLWYERLDHANEHGLSNMARNGNACCFQWLSNTDASDFQSSVVWEASRTTIFKQRKTERASGLLDLAHTDVCGLIEVPSFGRARYFVTFIDDHSIWVVVYRIKLKSEAKVLSPPRKRS